MEGAPQCNSVTGHLDAQAARVLKSMLSWSLLMLYPYFKFRDVLELAVLVYRAQSLLVLGKPGTGEHGCEGNELLYT